MDISIKVIEYDDNRTEERIFKPEELAVRYYGLSILKLSDQIYVKLS